MSSASIALKIKAGLARANIALGSDSSDLIYLVSKSTTEGTLLASGVTTETDILLLDAAFKSYDATTENSNILAGDRQLVCNGDVTLKQGDTIKEGSTLYTIINLDIKAPTSDVLAYIAQVRKR